MRGWDQSPVQDLMRVLANGAARVLVNGREWFMAPGRARGMVEGWMRGMVNGSELNLAGLSRVRVLNRRGIHIMWSPVVSRFFPGVAPGTRAGPEESTAFPRPLAGYDPKRSMS